MNIVGRAAWGARSPKNVATVAASRRILFVVHYSFGPADQSVRAIQDWCMDDRGFSDIDYNFLVRGTTGEIYTGRGWDVVGAHTKGYNAEGIGVCVITKGPISAGAKNAVRWLHGEGSRRAGHPLAVRGHRDLDQTECPGDEIYAWLKSGDVSRETSTRNLYFDTPPMEGDDVKAVQKIVGVKIDGWFGVYTEDAVMTWQGKHGLTTDGVVGPKTRAAMKLPA